MYTPPVCGGSRKIPFSLDFNPSKEKNKMMRDIFVQRIADLIEIIENNIGANKQMYINTLKVNLKIHRKLFGKIEDLDYKIGKKLKELAIIY